MNIYEYALYSGYQVEYVISDNFHFGDKKPLIFSLGHRAIYIVSEIDDLTLPRPIHCNIMQTTRLVVLVIGLMKPGACQDDTKSSYRSVISKVMFDSPNLEIGKR